MPKYYRLNNRITGVSEVRVIDETGKQIGLLPIGEALRLARDRKLDLIEIAPQAQPPVTKIMEWGKFLYQQKKKERKGQTKKSTTKNIRLTFGISAHDIGVRAKKTAEFLADGDKVKIDMVLRGRERTLQNFARKKIDVLLDAVRAKQDFKIEQGLKRMPFGLTMTITK